MSFLGDRLHLGPLPMDGNLPGFDDAAGWLNSAPLTPADLRGKVVLVDFWTYTCINWLRTLGYVRAWAERYADRGLVVVGVHTPEFPFERDEANVRRAVADMRVTWPVALDPDYGVWRAFANHYWPAIYLADAEGSIRYHHFGEGAYDETERAIQRLLRDAHAASVPDDLAAVSLEGIEVQADWGSLGSPETYVGYQQSDGFASPGGAEPDVPRTYAVPGSLRRNEWALAGEWTVEGGAGVSAGTDAGIVFRYHARDVNLVLRSRDGASIPFRVLVDGEAPGPAHGLDVDAAGNGTLTDPRLYQLIRSPGAVADRTVEIRFDAQGAEAYVFTFG